MNKYICKKCNIKIRASTVIDLVEHLIDEHGFIELPHKALNEFTVLVDGTN